MTDKRTPPDAAARGRKRAAPTIDLTATEVPPAHEAATQPPPPQEPPVADPESAPAKNKSAGNVWTWTRANISGPTLAAGIAGAVLMSLVMFGLWLTGLVPVRYAEPAAVGARVAGLEKQIHDLQSRPAGAIDTKSIDELNDRFAKIEDSIAKLPPGDAGVAARLAASENAMKALGLALTALSRRSDDIAGNATQARDRAEALDKALTELRASVQDAVKNTSAGIPPAELDALQKRIAAAVDGAARLALSAAALHDAVASGAPFAVELAQAKSLGANDKVLVLLEPFAIAGVPTQAALAAELRALMPAMIKVSGAQAPGGGFFERLQANAGNLVRIRPVDAPPGDDASAVLARIEIDAAHADITAALADLGKLTDATRAPAQGWIAKAQARQAALAAARQFAADTARALAPKAGAK